jgi:hypothetical protein
MGGMSSQVFWKQHWDAAADSILRQALTKLGHEIHELSSQQWDARTASIGGVRDYQCSYVAPAAADWSSVLLFLDAVIGEQLAAELSRLTSGPSIVFSEYDQVTWGYVLFENGAPSDRFWSVPEAVKENAETVRGTASILTRVFKVPQSDIAPYLRHFSPEEATGEKAFPNDEFALSEHWVRVDFMRRLGLEYPDPGKTPGGRYIQIIESPDAK